MPAPRPRRPAVGQRHHAPGAAGRRQRTRRSARTPQHIEVRHVLRPECVQIQRIGTGPRRGLLGRHTDDVIRRQPRETVRLIQAGLGPRQITRCLLDLQKLQHAARLHGHGETATVNASIHTRRHACRRLHTTDRDRIGMARQGLDTQPRRGGCVRSICDHNPRERVITRRKVGLDRPRATGGPRALGRVDDDPRRHRLASRAVRQHHASRVSIGIPQDIAHRRTAQKRDPLLFQRKVQRALQRQRRDVATTAPYRIIRVGMDDQFVEQLTHIRTSRRDIAR